MTGWTIFALSTPVIAVVFMWLIGRHESLVVDRAQKEEQRRGHAVLPAK